MLDDRESIQNAYDPQAVQYRLKKIHEMIGYVRSLQFGWRYSRSVQWARDSDQQIRKQKDVHSLRDDRFYIEDRIWRLAQEKAMPNI